MTQPQRSTNPPCLDALVRELDILIRARYPLISVTTFEELRFRRLMAAVAQLERHRAKGLLVWSRVPAGPRWPAWASWKRTARSPTPRSRCRCQGPRRPLTRG